MIFQLAKLGFTIWGIYKGFWVLSKVWKWSEQKLQDYRAEQTYLNGLAAHIRLEREQ